MSDEPGHSKECLYVVDSISFDTEDSEVFPSSLIHGENLPLVPLEMSTSTHMHMHADPLYPHIYYVVHSEGIHQVTLPWLLDMENYNSPETTCE